MRLIDADKILADFPIRKDHYDKENGSEDFIMGIETVLEYINRMADEQEIKQETKMTNAEKLAKDTKTLANIVAFSTDKCALNDTCLCWCNECPIGKHGKGCTKEAIKEWLESEVNEDETN